MQRIYFVPTNDAEFRKNHGIYTALLNAPDSVYVERYDIPAEQVALALRDDNALKAGNARVLTARAELTAAEGDYEVTVGIVTKDWTREAGDIKRKPMFIESDGEALKILGPFVDDDFGDKNPKLRLETTPEGVKVSFTKSGADGINLYCQRAGDGAMQLVRMLTKTGWVDARPNLDATRNESRQYSAYLVVNDHEVGQVSLPAPISVRPHA